MTETDQIQSPMRSTTPLKIVVIWLFLCFCSVVFLNFNSNRGRDKDVPQVHQVAPRMVLVAKFGPELDESTREQLLTSAADMEPNETAKVIIKGELPEDWESEDLSEAYRLMAEQLESPTSEREAELQGLADEGVTRFTISGLMLAVVGLTALVTLFLGKSETAVEPKSASRLDAIGVLGAFFAWHIFGFVGAAVLSSALIRVVDPFLVILMAQGLVYGLMLFILSRTPLKKELNLFVKFDRSWLGKGYLLSIVIVLTVNVLVTMLLGEAPQSENPILTLFADAAIWKYVCLGLLVVVVGPFFEEVMFRGWIYGGLREKWGDTAALVVSAALFAVIHGDAPGMPALFSLGVIFGWVYRETGSLWAPFLVHAFWNATTFSLIISVMP